MNENTWLKVRNLREGSLVGVEPLTGFEIESLRTLAAGYDAAIATKEQQENRFTDWHSAAIFTAAIVPFVAVVIATQVLWPGSMSPLMMIATYFCLWGPCSLLARRHFLYDLLVRPLPAPLQPIGDNVLNGEWLNDVAPHDYVALDTLMTANGPARAYASAVLASGRELTIFELDALRTAHKRAQQDIERAHATSKGQDVRRALAAGL